MGKLAFAKLFYLASKQCLRLGIYLKCFSVHWGEEGVLNFLKVNYFFSVCESIVYNYVMSLMFEIFTAII